MFANRFVIAAALLFVTSAFAEDEKPKLKTPAPTMPATEASPSAEPQLMPEPAPSPTTTRPSRDTSAEPPVTEKMKKVGTSKTEVFSQNVQDHIRFRQVETTALADRGVQSAWDRSVVAKTFPDKREALKEYYTLLYARMAKIDPSLKKLIETRATAVQNRLTQKFVAVDALDTRDQSTSGRVVAE